MNSKKDLLLIKYDDMNEVRSKKIEGLQGYSKHPVYSRIGVLGRKLQILSTKNLSIINSTDLSLARDKNQNGVISFSPCGKFLAISYAVNGEIEIRDSENLELIKNYESHGIPQSDISWDITSRYLACRFKNRENHGYKLIVWDTKNDVEVLNTKSSSVEISKEAFKWHPDMTKLACLVDRKKIQVFELQ